MAWVFPKKCKEPNQVLKGPMTFGDLEHVAVTSDQAHYDQGRSGYEAHTPSNTDSSPPEK